MTCCYEELNGFTHHGFIQPYATLFKHVYHVMSNIHWSHEYFKTCQNIIQPMFNKSIEDQHFDIKFLTFSHLSDIDL